MDPAREAQFWPHRNRVIYQTYHRIFDCRRHGWANLQSIHLNLSFHGDREFARLHAAVRFLIPVLPALAASSPVVEGKVTGRLNNRLEAYRGNQQRVPSITGRVIPEAVYSRRRYRDRILKRMYRDIAPHDPEKILQHEWLNSRGAIPRFDRDTIELRMLDVQECPQADIAVISAVVETIKGLARGRFAPVEELMAWETGPLEKIFLAVLRKGESAVIRDGRYLSAFGLSRGPMTAGELWAHLAATLLTGASDDDRAALRALDVIFSRGTLARRIVRALGKAPSRERIQRVYRELCECLSEGRMFFS
jgi:carboxylate-amine ligase